MNQLGKGIATAGIWLAVAVVAVAAPNMVPVYVSFFALFATLFVWAD